MALHKNLGVILVVLLAAYARRNLIMAQAPDLICLQDYETKAFATMDSRYRDFFATGADDEQTLRDNQKDFKR